LNKRSLWTSTAAALLVAAALAGCGTTTYFAGRTLPPSGIANRVMIAIQNPSAFSILQFVDAYYDIRFKYNSANTGAAYSIAGIRWQSAYHHPEYARGAFGRGLWIRGRRLHHDQL
jgi:hypothetical protein